LPGPRREIASLCDAALRGRKVTLRYDPHELSSVLVFVDGVRTQRALPQPIGRTAAAAPPRRLEPASRRAGPTRRKALVLDRPGQPARLADEHDEHWGDSAYVIAMAWRWDGRQDASQ
jgi:Mu transposase, C-terminal